MAVRPRRSKRFRASLERASAALDADWSIETTWPALAANTARFLGRDYPLDQQSDEAVLGRFDVRGYERLRATLADGRGAILVGSHLGAHIAGVHWLFRRGVSVQAAGSTPQARFSRAESPIRRRRATPPGRDVPAPRSFRAVAVERVFRARAALRDGLAIYLNGDIPWSGPNTCAGRLLGRSQRFLAIWTELAVLTNAPVFLVFCTHLPGGRFALEIEAIGHLHSGEEESAVADYLKQLEARIEASPADAVAHLEWPCYVSPPAPARQTSRRRASRPSAPSSPAVARSRHMRSRRLVPESRGESDEQQQ